MTCKCNISNIIHGDEVEKVIVAFLTELKIDGTKWRTLYQCKYCGLFWEERYTDDRFVGKPSLVKVTDDYVLRNWGDEFFNK